MGPEAGEPITIYHNPRCGKSRSTLALLRENGVEPTVVEYLKTPLSQDELRVIVRLLEMPAADLVRKSEAVYKEELAGRTLTDEEWLEAMARHPILMERPIVVRGQRAVLGRPPENVLKLL